MNSSVVTLDLEQNLVFSVNHSMSCRGVLILTAVSIVAVCLIDWSSRMQELFVRVAPSMKELFTNTSFGKDLVVPTPSKVFTNPIDNSMQE